MDAPPFNLPYLFSAVDTALTNSQSTGGNSRCQLLRSCQADLKSPEIPVVDADYFRARLQRLLQLFLIVNFDQGVER